MSSNLETTEELIDHLQKDPTNNSEKSRPRKGLDPVVFTVAGAVAVAIVVWGFVSPHGLGGVSKRLLDGTMSVFGWLFIIAAAVFAVFVIVIAASKFGLIRLGKDDDQPEFSTWSWIAMMFATGMGIGLVFYGVAEPLFFYLSPPPGTVDGSTGEAMGVAMGQTLFHWTLFPWAMYAIVGLAMAYGSFRLGRAQLFSAMFTPLFGERAVNGFGGRIINILAILATLFGSACSLGLGAIQIGGGIESVGLLPDVTSPVLVVVIAVLTAAFVGSAVSGIERGIQWLSNINMILAVAVALIVFIGGPTLFILNVIPTSIGSFIEHLPQMASRTAATGDQTVQDWLGTWSVFYWAWWVSWSPFVGLFIARISKGRTIRQFVTGVLLVPSLVSLLWFAIFGGGAIGIQERAESGVGEVLSTVVNGEPDLDFDLILFDVLAALPLPNVIAVILMVVTVVLIAIFFVTGADSASIVMGSLAERGAVEPTKKSVIFWGVATGGVAAVMLLAGGDDPKEALNGLKNITIVSALPFVIVMLLLCVALWKDLSRDHLVVQHRLATMVLQESVVQAVDNHDGPFEFATREVAAEEINEPDGEAHELDPATVAPAPESLTTADSTTIGSTPTDPTTIGSAVAAEDSTDEPGDIR